MRKRRILLVAGTGIFCVQQAFAGGFEKPVMWSGKYDGQAGAAVSVVDGAEALYFNPAGLATGRQGFEVSGNFDPTFMKFTGPPPSGPNVSTGWGFSPLFGALMSYGITPQWGIGLGAYVGSGLEADFDNVASSPFSITAPVRTDLYSTEFSVGTGYEILPGLRIGAAYRIVMTHASLELAQLSQVGGGNSALADIYLQNMSQTRYNGFRLGAEYTAPDKSWGLGATWRTPVTFAVSTNSVSGTVQSTAALGTSGTLRGTSASASATLPSQITVGGNYLVLPTVRMLLEYVWSNYHTDQQLGIAGPALANSLGGTLPLPSVYLGWQNETDVRVGFDCTAVPGWTFRAGYVWASQVTPNQWALLNASPPGSGSEITVGAGTSIIDNTLDLDGALEYGFSSGTVTPSQKVGPFTYAGNYSADALGIHLGATYRF